MDPNRKATVNSPQGTEEEQKTGPVLKAVENKYFESIPSCSHDYNLPAFECNSADDVRQAIKSRTTKNPASDPKGRIHITQIGMKTQGKEAVTKDHADTKRKKNDNSKDKKERRDYKRDDPMPENKSDVRQRQPKRKPKSRGNTRPRVRSRVGSRKRRMDPRKAEKGRKRMRIDKTAKRTVVSKVNKSKKGHQSSSSEAESDFESNSSPSSESGWSS